MTLKFGIDPEFFCVDKDNLAISPALLEMECGLKPVIDDLKHPIYHINLEKNFSWMMDGVAFELTILKPLDTAVEMYDIVNSSLDYLESKIKNLDGTLQLYKKPVVGINPDRYIPLLNNERIYQGFIFGCDKDNDAIISDYVCETQDVTSHKYRYAGGHFHTSGSKFFEHYIPAIKLMAICMGNYFIANSLYPDLEKQRALTYGRPGRYRIQKYKNGDSGLEYRTPSNSWLSFPLSGYQEMFRMAELAVHFLETERVDIIRSYLDSTIKAITTADQNLARKILEEINQ